MRDSIETKSIAPGFLIAMPQLNDPNFFHSVVLMFDHGKQGAMGVVINGPLMQPISNLVQSLEIELPEGSKGSEDPLLLGGPVAVDRCFILYNKDLGKMEGTMTLDENVFLGCTLECLNKVLCEKNIEKRVILGYAGWSPQQLDAEIKAGFWLTMPFEKDILFDTKYEDVWETCIRRLGIKPETLFNDGSGSIN